MQRLTPKYNKYISIQHLKNKTDVLHCFREKNQQNAPILLNTESEMRENNLALLLS